MRPPRALWVPFDLGRPLGEPNDAALQNKVLRAALALLERRDGPVVLEDFPEDAPSQGDPAAMEGMVCPIPLRPPPSGQPPGIAADVRHEIDQLTPWWQLFRETHGRTTVGVGALPLPAAVDFMATLLATGEAPPATTDAGMALRNACEDVRNFYLEAAAMRPGGSAPAARLIKWFWGETRAGAMLLALHPVCRASRDAGLRHVGATQLVPRAQRHRLAATDHN